MQDNKKNIFIVINSLGCGGAEKNVLYLLEQFHNKFTIYLILLKDEIIYNVPKNVHIIILSKIKYNIFLFLLIPLYIIKLKKLIKKYNPQKIISFLEIANFVNILSTKNSIISFRISLHFFNKGFIKNTYKLLIKLLYPKARHIIVNSKENAEEIKKFLNITNIDKVSTIYNPINIKLCQKATNTNSAKFITVSRLDKQKNIYSLIEAFSTLNIPNKTLTIIGDGNEKNNLIQFVKQLKLQKQVVFLGYKKNVISYLQLSDYFIFSSIAEGFPNALIEAMSVGLPIITSDFKTGAREIIDPSLDFEKQINYPYYGPNGVLVSVNNFANDFKKLNLNKLTQKQIGLERFNVNNFRNNWNKIFNL